MTGHYKRTAPSAARNQEPIAKQLLPLLPENARILEIASGTGQHGSYICGLRSDIRWQYTDVDEDALASQNAYVADNPRQVGNAKYVDVMAENWWQGFSGVDVIYCANMIHIAPWEAALGLAKGAGALLGSGGLLCLYGPFLFDSGSAQSNLDFDISLKSRNPKWGVRTLESVKHMFADEGLNLTSTIGMPRDNFLLVFQPHS